MPFLFCKTSPSATIQRRRSKTSRSRVERGEFFGLLGPSGCGKTTTLRMIAGLEKSDTGTINFDDRDITSLTPEARGFGMVFQNYALFPHLNVFENVAFGLRARRKAKPEIAERVALALELVQLPAYEKRSVAELSGGTTATRRHCARHSNRAGFAFV